MICRSSLPSRLLVLFVLCLAPGMALASHPCEQDARLQGQRLLVFHGDGIGSDLVSVDEAVRSLPPARALVGQGAFDVLEVTGYIHRASYRMRFIYAQFPSSCVLMGHEILEIADPY